MLLPQAIAHRLSDVQRDCLLKHCNGPQSFRVDSERPTKKYLIDQKLLQPRRADIASWTSRPRTLELSALGQQVACIVLGEMIELLVYNQQKPDNPRTDGVRFDAAMMTRDRHATDVLLKRLQYEYFRGVAIHDSEPLRDAAFAPASADPAY